MDAQATTLTDPRVLDAMLPVFNMQVSVWSLHREEWLQESINSKKVVA